MRTLITTGLMVLMIACSKDDPAPSNNASSMEIDHHDWDPDTLVVDSILIDLNNDSSSDLKLVAEKIYQGTSPSGGPYYNYFAKCISVNTDLQISIGTEVDPAQQVWNCLELNDPISTDLTWYDSFILKGQVISAGAIGTWDTNANEGYIGIKFESNGTRNFGWIKVNVNYNGLIENRYEIICFEYALSGTDDAIIHAGQVE